MDKRNKNNELLTFKEFIALLEDSIVHMYICNLFSKKANGVLYYLNDDENDEDDEDESHKNSITWFREVKCFDEWLSSAFVYANTPQGNNFWYKLSLTYI